MLYKCMIVSYSHWDFSSDIRVMLSGGRASSGQAIAPVSGARARVIRVSHGNELLRDER